MRTKYWVRALVSPRPTSRGPAWILGQARDDKSIITLLIFSLLSASLWAAPKKVETYVVSNQNFTQKIELIGTLKAHREAILTTPVAGVLTHVWIQEGALVKKNQLLAEIRNDFQEKSLHDSGVTVANKKSHLKRLQALYQQGDISLKDLEDAQSDLANAEKSFHQTEDQVSNTKFKAPFAGTCGLFRAEVGTHLASGSQVVAVYDTSSYLAYFSVPEDLITRLKLNQSLQVKDLPATLIAFEHRLNPKTHQAYAKAALKECPGCILGAKVPVQLVFEYRSLSVPAEAVFLKNGLSYVYRVLQGKALLTPVTPGTRAHKNLEITQGLKAGDVVILRGQGRIQHDDPVH